MTTQLIRSKRRTLSLQVTADASLIVRAPEKLSEKIIRRFIEEKLPWITQKQRQAREVYRPPKKFEDGEEFLYLGRPCKLRVADLEKEPVLLKDGAIFLSKDYQPHATQFLEKWYRRQALEIISARAAQYSKFTGLKFSKIKITAAKTRWGSCSPSGTLSFSWRLIMAPLEVVDYVVVHEIVHLEEKNHGRNFWKKVGNILPDYKQQLRWLRLHEPSMAL